LVSMIHSQSSIGTASIRPPAATPALLIRRSALPIARRASHGPPPTARRRGRRAAGHDLPGCGPSRQYVVSHVGRDVGDEHLTWRAA
jgi:hypothetical protein